MRETSRYHHCAFVSPRRLNFAEALKQMCSSIDKVQDGDNMVKGIISLLGLTLGFISGATSAASLL